ncbi:hypothetical protein JST97_02875 [bacterium]|nr:hypothetical protein [bacterium]
MNGFGSINFSTPFNQVALAPQVKPLPPAEQMGSVSPDVFNVTLTPYHEVTRPKLEIGKSMLETIPTPPAGLSAEKGPEAPSYPLLKGEVTYKPLSFDLSKANYGKIDLGVMAYPDQLEPLKETYPGLPERLKEAEARAWIVSMTNALRGMQTRLVLENPPWPNTSFGSSRENIQKKAQELQKLHPQLNSNQAADYDFGAAQARAEELFGEMQSVFSQPEFKGSQFAARAKSPQSLEVKLARRVSDSDQEFSLAHLTDTVGARVDCTGLKMLGDAAHLLEKRYQGKIVAKDDYLSRPGALGYRALHYVVDLGDRMGEIQLSTQDLRATDLATHDTLYKPNFQVDESTAEKLRGAADRVMDAEAHRFLLWQK